MKNKIYSCLLIILSILALNSCSKEPSESGGFKGEENYKYFLLSALGSWPNTVHYLTATNDITQGEMNLKREGDEVNSKGTYAYIVKNGFIYNYKTDQGVLKKFKYTNDKLVTVKEVPYSFLSDISSFVWIDNKTLLILGTTGDGLSVRYSIINSDDLQIIKEGTIQGLLPFPESYNHYTIGATTYTDGILYLQYGFRDDKWMSPDYYNFATIKYDNFEVLDTRIDERASGISNSSPYFHTTFSTEKDTFYYASFPRLSKDTRDSYLFRVNKGAKTYDQDYVINLTQLFGGKKVETLLQYVGDNKMMALYRDPSLGNSYNARYVIIDLETKQIVRELTELPNDEPYEWGAFVENNKLFIAINGKEGNNYVWIYDYKTDSINKGIKIPDHISGYARFDKFYDE